MTPSKAVYRRRRLFFFSGILLLLVAIAVAVWLIIAQPWADAASGDPDPAKTPSASPTASDSETPAPTATTTRCWTRRACAGCCTGASTSTTRRGLGGFQGRRRGEREAVPGGAGGEIARPAPDPFGEPPAARGRGRGLKRSDTAPPAGSSRRGEGEVVASVSLIQPENRSLAVASENRTPGTL